MKLIPVCRNTGTDSRKTMAYPHNFTLVAVDKVELQNKYKHLKLQMRNVLHHNKYCGICLDNTDDLSNIHDSAIISNWQGSYLTTMADVLTVIFNDKLPSTLSSKCLCQKCKDAVTEVYTFITNIQRTSEIIENFSKQLEQRIDDISKTTNITSDYSNFLIVIDDPEIAEESMTSPQSISDEEIHKTITENALICDLCQEIFTSKKAIKFHIETLHYNDLPGQSNSQEYAKNVNYKKLVCPECKVNNCKHEKYLDYFQKQRNSGKTFLNCPSCKYTCRNVFALIGHVNRIHLKKSVFKCHICSKAIFTKTDYQSHMRIYHVQRHECMFCDKKFKEVSNLRQHTIECENEERPFKCHLCRASFLTSRKLKYHKKRHEEKYPCELCLTVLTNKMSYKHHMDMHKGYIKRKFICAICKRNYPTKIERDNHMTQHNPDEKPYCETCDMVFDNPKLYFWHTKSSMHYRTANPGKKMKHQCKKCDYSTEIATSLEAHVNRYHLKVMPYQCDMCERKFTGKRPLEIHLQSHEAKSRQCDVCGKYLKGPTAMKVHMRIHTGEKPYKCNVCSEMFITSAVRRMHILKRHSEKNVPCPLCNTMFFTLSLMRSHFKRVHWTLKGEKFDYRKVKGLKEDSYDLFRDRRLMVINSDCDN